MDISKDGISKLKIHVVIVRGSIMLLEARRQSSVAKYVQASVEKWRLVIASVLILVASYSYAAPPTSETFNGVTPSAGTTGAARAINGWTFSLLGANGSIDSGGVVNVTNDTNQSSLVDGGGDRAAEFLGTYASSGTGQAAAVLAATSGEEFTLQSIIVEQGLSDGNDYRLVGYRDGSAVSGATQDFTAGAYVVGGGTLVTVSGSAWQNLDAVRIVRQGGQTDIGIYVDDITVGAAAVPPTATVVVADTALAVGETSLVTFTFSQAVTGFTNGDLSIANGTLSAVSSGDGGVTWTATFTPMASITDTTNVIALNMAGVSAVSTAVTGTGTQNSNNYAIDTVRPTASIVVSDNDLAVGETSGVTITFSEAVTGFTNADLTIASGTLSAVGSINGGITWTATLTPTASITDTTNVITLANTGVTDAAGNAGTGTTNSNNYAIDTARPTASIVVADNALSIGETSLVTITFSEAVSGFDNSALTVANGTLSTVSTSDDITFTATFTPTASITDATNLITLDNTYVADAAGNSGSGTTNSNNYAIDTVRPTASIVVADSNLLAGETSLVTITFSEAVTGFTNADLTIANGTLSAVSSGDGGITWTATLTPTASITDATNLITLANTGMTDAAGNAGTGTTDSNNYTISTVRPTASIVVADTALAAGEASLVTITFSEAVTGFANADLTITNGSLSAVSSGDGGVTWTATFTPTASITDATNIITLANTGVQNAAGNTGSGTTDSNNYAIDTVRPTTSIVVADTALAIGETSLATITFSEAVTGFTNADLTIANGTLSAVSSGDGGITWTATLTPTASTTDATNVITLDNTGVIDAAGNTGSGTTDSNNYAIDSARPTASIVVADASLIAGETSLVTITFSEAVTGFTNADLTIANGTLSSVSSGDGGITWTTTFTPTASVTAATNLITLDNTGVVDSAGNAGTGTTDSNNYAVDTVRPSLASAITLSDTALRIGDTATVTFTFAEAVAGFTLADVTAENGVLSALSSSDGGITWTATLTPNTSTADATNILTLDLTGVQDLAGNAGSGTDSSANYAVDTSAAILALVTGVSTPTNDPTPDFTFSSDQPGTASATGSCGIAGSPAIASPGNKTVTLSKSDGTTPLDDGTYSDCAVVVTDLAGNASTPLAIGTFVVDTTSPTGQTVQFDESQISLAESVGTSFTISGAELGATFTYTISSDGGGMPVPGSGTVATLTQQVSGISLSTLQDGTLTLSAIFTDTANNAASAVTASATLDKTLPNLNSSTPADGATNAAYNTNLVLTFSEPLVAGSGNLTLFDAADDSVVEAFAVGSVSLVGNVLTLDPASNLVPTRSYYLQVASTALMDAAGNPYAGISDKTTLNFTVTNTAPVANADIGTVAEDASVSISVLANDTDADSSLNLASVTVATAPLHGSTSVNTGTGVITYTPAANYHGADSFTYTVEDVFSSVSNIATVTITITPLNDIPVAVADITTTPEDNPVSIDVAANDTDIDIGDAVVPATIVIVGAPADGTAVVANGEVLYTPNLNFNGSDGFTYTIKDQSSATSSVTSVVINVTGVNDLPTAGADTATVDEDGSVDIDVLANDSDEDGSIDATSVSILAAASNGSTSVDALTGVILYTPTANFNGTDSFSYTVQDSSGGSATATVTVTVTSINDAPVANADLATLQEDVAHTINVLGNDTDLDGTLVPVSVQVVTVAGQGTTSVNAGTGAIVYLPSENFNGSDSFTYRVQDNQGAWSVPATVTLTVQDLNDEPLANNDSAATPEDTAATINLLGNDSDVDGTLNPAVLVLLTQPANGSLTDNGNGTVLYTPTANFFGSNSFTYTVADDDGGVSNTATATITVNPVNDAPVISGTPAVTVVEDSAYSFTPTASDVDPSTTLTYSVANLPVWASFNTSTGALTGTPENDHVGNHSGIVITVSDDLLSASLPAFAINVSNVNDPPVITGTSPASINQGGSYNFTPTVVDVDAGTTLTYTITNQPSWASFDPATGAFTGTPGNSDVGIYNNIVISVSDGVTTTPLTSFNVTVANVNDAPVIAADSYNLNEGSPLNPDAATGVLANDVDMDNDTLTATLVTAPRNASQFTLNDDGSFNYLHSGDETRIDSFTYRISDGTVTSNPVTVNLSITAVNDAPTFVTEPDIATLEGTAYSYEVGVTDSDSVVILALIEGPAWLSLTGNRLTGTAPINEIGAVSVVLRAADGQYTVDQTYNLTVVEQETSLVTITTSWLGLPSIVDSTVDLIVTLTHNKGPALSGAALNVALRDVDSASTMANCTASTNAFTCPVNLAAGNSTSFRLRLTPEEEGNLIVNLNLTRAAEQVAATITDVSVTERAVSQGDVTFNIANATALASINLLNDGTRELVAGTALGDTVKLLNYTISSGTAQVIGEIENRGYTDRVRVADIDQDGLEDIVVVNRSGDASAVYYDRGAGFETEHGSVTLAHAREALVRDLNDDGFPELILGAGGFNLYVYENNEGIYDIAPLVFNSPASIRHFALLRRLPADAPLEGTLVITSSTAVQLVRFGLNPDGGAAKPDDGEGLGGEGISEKFSLVRELPLAGVSSIQLVDIDGDGREEIVASTTHQSNSSEASGLTVIAVTPDDQLQEVVRLGAASAKHLEVADFNGDGLPDLLVANDNNSYQFYRGTGEVANWTLTNTILYHSSTLVIPEDVNGDGLADVLVYEDGEEQVELYLSAPDGDTGETADLVASASVTPVQPNTYHFEYTLNLANQGAFVAENVRVNLPLPDGIGVVTLPDNCTHDEEVDEVNCTLPNLEAAAEEAMVLILEGDSRINDLSLTGHATSDALEVETANNSVTTSLSGMFQYKRARIKGGGGCFDYLLLAGLLGLELRRRRKTSSSSDPAQKLVTSPGRKVASLLLPMSAALVLMQPSQPAEAEAPVAKNSYVEGTFGIVTSDWDTLNFVYDLGDTTQEGALVEKDDQRLGWQLLYGFRAHRNLALEVGYIDSGETELEVEAIVSHTGSVRQMLIDNAPISGDGPYVGLRASYFADEEQELYLKAGLWSWSAGYDLMIDDQHEWVTKDGTDWLLGMGFAVPVSQNFRIGGSLQSTSLADERLMLIGFNLVYNFDVGF
jgi:hypothetical protein